MCLGAYLLARCADDNGHGPKTRLFAVAVHFVFSCVLGVLLSVEYADLICDYGMPFLIIAETCLSMNDVSRRCPNRRERARFSASILLGKVRRSDVAALTPGFVNGDRRGIGQIQRA